VSGLPSDGQREMASATWVSPLVLVRMLEAGCGEKATGLLYLGRRLFWPRGPFIAVA